MFPISAKSFSKETVGVGLEALRLIISGCYHFSDCTRHNVLWRCWFPAAFWRLVKHFGSQLTNTFEGLAGSATLRQPAYFQMKETLKILSYIQACVAQRVIKVGDTVPYNFVPYTLFVVACTLIFINCTYLVCQAPVAPSITLDPLPWYCVALYISL